MAKFDDKISHLISQQAPDFVLDDHPYFLEFVKAYYTFMESAELTLTNIGDPDRCETEPVGSPVSGGPRRLSGSTCHKGHCSLSLTGFVGPSS